MPGASPWSPPPGSTTSKGSPDSAPPPCRTGRTGRSRCGPGPRLLRRGRPGRLGRAHRGRRAGAHHRRHVRRAACASAPAARPNGLLESLPDLVAPAAAGGLVLPLGGTYPPAEAARAHAGIEARRARGKVVLLP
nr:MULTISPECIES: zinc-binding dehydrogenase [Streptomyces]